jgi:hypothetical protein
MACVVLLGVSSEALAHGFGPAVTWNREVSRLVYARCASCHRPGGTAFSLMTYRDAQPRAAAIRDSVLSRRMPPWGAVTGFGDFRDDQGLTQNQIDLLTDWVENGSPRGNNRNVLPDEPTFETAPRFEPPANGIAVSGDVTLPRQLALDGLWPDSVPPGASIQIVAALPDGRIEPLLWLYEHDERHRHPFQFRRALDLPVGTIIRGVPPEARVILLPATLD